MEKFRKERQEYEDKQLQLCEGMRANRGTGDAVGKTPEKLDGNLAENPAAASRPKPAPTSEKPDLYNYDVIELPENRERQIIVNDNDEYGQPVDALQQPVDAIQQSLKEGKSGAPPSMLKPLLSDAQQKNVLNTTATGQAYTPVFSPQQQAEGRGDLREKRAMSDLSPRHGYVNAGPIPENQARKDSLENAKAAAANSNTRRMAKEVVEFDPERQRMFRMTSRKGKSKEEVKAGGDNTDDSGISSDASPVVGGPGTTEGKGSASTPPGQGRAAVVPEYAMVNIADKKKNRIGGGDAKCEGSGVPKHFVAPPVLSS